jgi:predicted PurR-regulated permease PerM
MGQQLKIHPLAAIFAVLVGGELGGIVGIYLAVPVIAALRVVLSASAGERLERGYRRCADISADAHPVLMETASG